MTNQKYKLPLKFEPNASHCLSWSIRDEILHGNHTFEGLRKLILDGKVEELRRYSEVLHHKTHQDDSLLIVLCDSMNERISLGKNSVKEMTDQVVDWGFSYSSRKNKVTQNIKVIGREYKYD